MSQLHKHIIIFSEIDNPPLADDENMIEQWLSKNVIDMNMEILREASASYCDQVGNRGMTADIHITTSHSVIHTWDEGQPYLEYDFYTCSDLDKDIIFESLKRFKPKNTSYALYDRHKGIKLLETGKVEWKDNGLYNINIDYSDNNKHNS